MSGGRIALVAPSSVVSKVELSLGLERLREEGLSARVHPQCRSKHLFFAGSDEERARAFYDSAVDESVGVLWAARGGSGSARILPILEKMTAERGVPDRKLFVGYSDSTLLLEFVRSRWGWATLHAPMPGLREFFELSPKAWKATLAWVRRERVAREPWGKLRFVGGRKPAASVTGELVGGNLTVWASACGTPFAGRGRGKIVFFEDVAETLYRVERVATQVFQSGGLDEARAIVLGTFDDCVDRVARGFKVRPRKPGAIVNPKPADLAPIRSVIPQRRALDAIFGEIGERLGVPVAYGLPVGHGSGLTPLPLGAEYRLSPDGAFELRRWDWLDERDRG